MTDKRPTTYTELFAQLGIEDPDDLDRRLWEEFRENRLTINQYRTEYGFPPLPDPEPNHICLATQSG